MNDILESIDHPGQLRSLSESDLTALCAQIRAAIIATTSATGGHLAANLGVVELTVALLRNFEPHRDRVVWDTGHQCYAWKLLTGRRDRFSTLRQFDGLSGFIKPDESPCDAFAVGHAGTALSAALGMAAARDRRRGDHHVVAVVGDAALCNGVSLEALNNLAETTRRFIIVLNDNEMSIGGNVGALAHYFGRLLTNTRYNRCKALIERVALRMRMSPLRRTYHRMEEAIKSLVLENAFFEELGIRYIGPIDGHNLRQMDDAFSIARDYDRPILLHVRTCKGKGYAAAERDPEHWHATGCFDADNGKGVSTPRPGYSEVFGDRLCALAERDSRVVGITAAMCAGTGMGAFARRFPSRFFDVGICEEHAVTFAAGLAASGLRPVVALYSTFAQRAVDAVVHDICLQSLPVTLCLDRAGIVGGDGPTHHGIFDLAMLRPAPGLVIMQPRDEPHLAAMLETAISGERPCVIRYPRDPGPGLPAPERCEPLPVGVAEVLRAPINGKPSVWFWALGDMVTVALQSADRLDRDHGVACGVVDACFVKPLDRDLLETHAREGALIVTMENAARMGGFGSAVLECLAAAGHGVRVLRIGWPDEFVGQGTTVQLMRHHAIDAESVTRQIADFLRNGVSPRPNDP